MNYRNKIVAKRVVI